MRSRGRQPLDRPVVQVGRDPAPLVLGALDGAREQADAILLGALELRQRDGELSLRASAASRACR